MNNGTQSLYSRFAKEVIIVGAATALTSFSSIFFLPLVTKTLGADGYGIWSQVQLTVAVGSAVLSLGLPYALTRFLPAKTDKAEIRDDFYSVLLLTTLVSLPICFILLLASSPIARTFFDGMREAVIIAGLLAIVQVASSSYLFLLRSFRSVITYSIITTVLAYGVVGLVAYLALHGYGLSPMLLGSLAVQVAVLAILFFLVCRRIGIGRPRFHNITGYLRFALPTVPGSISWWVISLTDRYVIAYILGATSLGVYSAAYALGNTLFVLVGILGLVLTPAMSKLYDDGSLTELQTHMSYSLKYFLLLGIPFVFGAAVLSEPLLGVLSTPQIGAEGHQVVPLIAASILLFGAYLVISISLSLVKKTSTMTLIMAVAAAVNLALNVLLVPRIGITGSAIGVLVAYALALALGVYYSLKEIRFPIPWSSIVKSLIASILMAGIVWLIHPEGRAGTILTVLAGVGVYGAALLLLKGVRKDEISFFYRLFRKAGPGAT